MHPPRSTERKWIIVQGLAVFAVLTLASATQAQTPLAPAFTYQGLLTESGNPANGTYDFEFRLFDSPALGAQIGATLAQDDQLVTDGVFTVALNFGAGALTDQSRWLEIAVRPGDGGPFTLLSPRQALTPAPCAIFALNAPWSGLLGVPPGFADGVDDAGALTLPYAGDTSTPDPAFSVTNIGAGPAIEAVGSGAPALRAQAVGNGLAILGLGTISASTGSGADGAIGVHGEATNSAGITYGLYGSTASLADDAVGASGFAAATTGRSYGVRGRASSSSGGAAGVLGEATNSGGRVYGVHGTSASGSNDAAGVRGQATDATSLRTFGVHGSTAATGASAAGVRGEATAADGQTYGLHGITNSMSNAAAGVRGEALAGAGATFGVEGVTASPAMNATGVRGAATAGGFFDGPTYGVDGESAAGASDSAGVRGIASYSDILLAGTTFGVDGETRSGGGGSAGVRGRATGSQLGGATFGVDGSTNSFAFGAAGVRGTTTTAGAGGTAGVWGRDSGGMAGDGATFGVVGESTSADFRSAAVQARGNGTAAPGTPQAAALEINNGAIRVTGMRRPAGTLIVPPGPWMEITSFLDDIDCCPSRHRHCIGGMREIILINDLITPGSMILLTVDGNYTGYPYATALTAQVVLKASGSATIRLCVIGGDPNVFGPPPPGGLLRVNYLILNP